MYAPSIDGFSVKFFKSTWDITKHDTINAFKEFFERNKTYMTINCTLVTLIPKTPITNMVKDYMLISCCIVFYKIISRIMAVGLGKGLCSSINNSQAAFVPGKDIHNHILLAYKLIKVYSTKNGAPRCMLQMDLHKAYGTIVWEALETIMKELIFPHQFINWTMLTVRTVS